MINQKHFYSKPRHNFKYKFLFIALIPFAFLIKWLMALSPSFTEKVYSRVLYKAIMQPVSLFTGLFPISVAEIAVIFLVLFIPIRVIFVINKSVKLHKWSPLLKFSANIVMVGSLMFFIQNIVWNINYERLSFAENANIQLNKYSVKDLEGLCLQLINNTNTLREQVDEDTNGVMIINGGFSSIQKRSRESYDELQKIYPFLSGNYGPPKPIIVSRLMSHTNIIGIYSCLTGEANIDIDIPDMEIASTTLHEMAHQRGFAREDEANYISYAACMSHPDPDFKYSGSVLALQYSMNALYSEDPERYFELIKKYSEAYFRDIKDEQEYWKQFQGISKKVASKVNDTYLKINGETDGVKSYGRMVDLLLEEYNSKKSPLFSLIKR